MKIEIDNDNIFIPDFNDNKNEPENERIKIHWRHPTSKEKDKIKYISHPSILKDGSFDMTSMKPVLDYDLLVETFVFEVENLQCNKEKIKNGYDINNTAKLSDLKEEICKHILIQIEIIDSKKNNSKLPPTSLLKDGENEMPENCQT
jgi:hypothetical protein